MAKKIEVEIDVTTNVEPSIAELKRLKKEIKDTAAGSAEFALLQQQINDYDTKL